MPRSEWLLHIYYIAGIYHNKLCCPIFQLKIIRYLFQIFLTPLKLDLRNSDFYGDVFSQSFEIQLILVGATFTYV